MKGSAACKEARRQARACRAHAHSGLMPWIELRQHPEIRLDPDPFLANPSKYLFFTLIPCPRSSR